MLFNEGGGEVFQYGGRRHYGVCCAEKGIYRFTLTALGAAGHASLPRMGDNALLKLGPALQKIAAAEPPSAHRGTGGAATRARPGSRRSRRRRCERIERRRSPRC